MWWIIQTNIICLTHQFNKINIIQWIDNNSLILSLQGKILTMINNFIIIINIYHNNNNNSSRQLIISRKWRLQIYTITKIYNLWIQISISMLQPNNQIIYKHRNNFQAIVWSILYKLLIVNPNNLILINNNNNNIILIINNNYKIHFSFNLMLGYNHLVCHLVFNNSNSMNNSSNNRNNSNSITNIKVIIFQIQMLISIMNSKLLIGIIVNQIQIIKIFNNELL